MILILICNVDFFFSFFFFYVKRFSMYLLALDLPSGMWNGFPGTLLTFDFPRIVWNCFLVTMYLLVLGLLYGMGYFIVARLVAHCVEWFSRYLLEFNLLGIVSIDFQVIADQYFSEYYVECFSMCLLAHFLLRIVFNGFPANYWRSISCVLCETIFQVVLLCGMVFMELTCARLAEYHLD